MTQVLARKWRPRAFTELVGQEHVVRALENALAQQRLHHAYLFTGTRGVGKTTLARIIAKALNCETGITASPCGKCAACTEIDAGRFVDLLELDAASNTQVDNMRDRKERSGRYVNGRKKGSKFKLTDDQVREIRRLVAEGMPRAAAGRLFGVTRWTASAIASGRQRTSVL